MGAALAAAAERGPPVCRVRASLASSSAGWLAWPGCAGPVRVRSPSTAKFSTTGYTARRSGPSCSRWTGQAACVEARGRVGMPTLHTGQRAQNREWGASAGWGCIRQACLCQPYRDAQLVELHVVLACALDRAVHCLDLRQQQRVINVLAHLWRGFPVFVSLQFLVHGSGWPLRTSCSMAVSSSRVMSLWPRVSNSKVCATGQGCCTLRGASLVAPSTSSAPGAALPTSPARTRHAEECLELNQPHMASEEHQTLHSKSGQDLEVHPTTVCCTRSKNIPDPGCCTSSAVPRLSRIKPPTIGRSRLSRTRSVASYCPAKAPRRRSSIACASMAMPEPLDTAAADGAARSGRDPRTLKQQQQATS